ncbi:hypothetical protein D3C77_351910 [compost metagenome]
MQGLSFNAQGLQSTLETLRLLGGDRELTDHGVGCGACDFRCGTQCEEGRAECGCILVAHTNRRRDTCSALQHVNDVGPFGFGVVVQEVDGVTELADVLNRNLVQVGNARQVLADRIGRQLESCGGICSDFSEAEQVFFALDAHSGGAFNKGGDFSGGHRDAFRHGFDSVAHLVVGGGELAIVVACAIDLLGHAEHGVFEAHVAFDCTKDWRTHGCTCCCSACAIRCHAAGQRLRLLETFLGCGSLSCLPTQRLHASCLVAD